MYDLQFFTQARLVGINWRPHKIFTLARSTEAITRVLTALMRYSPHLGYSRHMCHMTAWVLVVYGGAAHEEAVFWTLAALLTEKLVTPTWPNTTNGAAGSLGGQVRLVETLVQSFRHLLNTFDVLAT